MAKSKLTSNRKFPFIRKELLKRYGETGTRQITALAEKHYAACERLCSEITKGEAEHLHGTILPTVALYKALQEIDGKNALETARNIMLSLCLMGGAVVGKVLTLPGMKGLFMKLLPKMAVNTFGPRCGFQYENYEATPNMLKMDMTACPYCRFATLFDCPELTPVFCESDFATYGDLPGIRFLRTQTIGTGGDRCDFQFIRE